MAIIGWAALCGIMMYLSIMCMLVFVNCAGDWNIGGVPNSFLTRTLAWAFVFVVGGGWYEVFELAPFTITLN